MSETQTHLSTVRFLTGETLFCEGDLGNKMYLINSGKVGIYRAHADREIQVAVLGEGDFFGEMAVLESLPRFATARVITDCALTEIDAGSLESILSSNMELAVRMLRKLSWRLRASEKRQMELSERVNRQQAFSDPVPGEAETMPGFSIDRGSNATISPSRKSDNDEIILQHVESGQSFQLPPGQETTIGRSDGATGIHPDVDLGIVDRQRSLSRRHAKLVRAGGKLLIIEELGVVNGTYLNGRKVNPGMPAEVRNGDELSFGLIRTILRFS